MKKDYKKEIMKSSWEEKDYEMKAHFGIRRMVPTLDEGCKIEDNSFFQQMMKKMDKIMGSYKKEDYGESSNNKKSNLDSITPYGTSSNNRIVR